MFVGDPAGGEREEPGVGRGERDTGEGVVGRDVLCDGPASAGVFLDGGVVAVAERLEVERETVFECCLGVE